MSMNKKKMWVFICFMKPIVNKLLELTRKFMEILGVRARTVNGSQASYLSHN